MSTTTMMGNLGCFVDESNIISFQMGDTPISGMDFPGYAESAPILPCSDTQWSSLQGANSTFNILYRGINNRKCEEIEMDIKQNRLLPRLINKQVNMLYGQGLMPYLPVLSEDGKFKRQWIQLPAVSTWLDSWKTQGLESDYKETAKACIKNFYTFGDYFIKWRFTQGKSIGSTPVSGFEILENKHCRLATTRKDVASALISYSDLRFIALGKWGYGVSNYMFYPRFQMSDVANYNFAAIGHYRQKAVGEFYGINETHQGTQPYIKGSNSTAKYINSFLKNSLAAKLHIIIPNAWIESKRAQITKICAENKKRAAKGTPLLTYNNIEVGTDFLESSLIEYINSEMRKISGYLSGEDNQGKAYATISYYNNSKGTEERWKIETVDMKYKEYIESLISYDKRADEVLLSSVGLDPSISSVSKDGVISKSGADVYYNYLIYLMQLNPEDEICSEPFNQALQLNFPKLYAQGYRLGFYRETPARQEEVAPSNRINQQQS